MPLQSGLCNALCWRSCGHWRRCLIPAPQRPQTTSMIVQVKHKHSESPSRRIKVHCTAGGWLPGGTQIPGRGQEVVSRCDGKSRSKCCGRRRRRNSCREWCERIRSVERRPTQPAVTSKIDSDRLVEGDERLLKNENPAIRRTFDLLTSKTGGLYTPPHALKKSIRESTTGERGQHWDYCEGTAELHPAAGHVNSIHPLVCRTCCDHQL